MNRTLLVLGGARSGKSTYAQRIAEIHKGPLGYIATAQAFDTEMADRISRHQAQRSERWRTIEAPMALGEAIRQAAPAHGALLVDCLTLWLSNVILGGHDPVAASADLLSAITACRCPLILVSNEVGMGIVPDNALGRQFRDEAGRLNQAVAAACAEAVLIVAGLPLVLKTTALTPTGDAAGAIVNSP